MAGMYWLVAEICLCMHYLKRCPMLCRRRVRRKDAAMKKNCWLPYYKTDFTTPSTFLIK
jgi:hypothetical protein